MDLTGNISQNNDYAHHLHNNQKQKQQRLDRWQKGFQLVIFSFFSPEIYRIAVLFQKLKIYKIAFLHY